jgi:hypothetical protein
LAAPLQLSGSPSNIPTIRLSGIRVSVTTASKRSGRSSMATMASSPLTTAKKAEACLRHDVFYDHDYCNIIFDIRYQRLADYIRVVGSIDFATCSSSDRAQTKHGL